MKIYAVGVMGLLLFCGTALCSDLRRSESLAPTPSNLPSQFGQDFVDSAVDFGAYMTSPFSWDREDWGNFLIVTAVTGGLLFVDRPLFVAVDPNKIQGLNDVLKPIQMLGDFRVVALPLPFLYFGSFFVGDKKLQLAAKLAMRSLAYQALINQFLKNATYRTKADNAFDFHLGPPKWEIPSSGAFPAGHASNVWAVMSAFAIVYKDDPLIPWICYGLALGNNVAQILNQDHWVSDLFFGAALGYFSTTFLASREEQRGFAIQASSKGVALGYSVQF